MTTKPRTTAVAWPTWRRSGHCTRRSSSTHARRKVRTRPRRAVRARRLRVGLPAPRSARRGRAGGRPRRLVGRALEVARPRQSSSRRPRRARRRRRPGGVLDAGLGRAWPRRRRRTRARAGSARPCVVAEAAPVDRRVVEPDLAASRARSAAPVPGAGALRRCFARWRSRAIARLPSGSRGARCAAGTTGSTCAA